MARPLFLLVAVGLLGCGEGGRPDCLVFTPTHDTVGGNVDIGVTVYGDVVEDRIAFETTGVEGAPGSLTLSVQSDCDDVDCAVDFDCGESTLTAGDAITCSVEDSIEGAEACSWSCQLSLTALDLEASSCRDVLEVVTVVGEHEVAAPGR